MDFPDFQPALFAATVMNAFEKPWCVAGGWAFDRRRRHDFKRNSAKSGGH